MKPFKFFSGYTNRIDFSLMSNEERRVFHIDVANIPRDQLNEYIRALTLRFQTPTIPIVDYPTILR